MSRTDNTDPFDVRVWYSPSGGFEHDHRFGTCDAPQSLADLLTAADLQCQSYFLVLPRAVCACGHQHEPWRPEENRRTRHTTRAQLRAAVGLWRGGWADDADSVVGDRPPRR